MSHRLDRISSLPDEVISHILSFLPTETSVATSVLSKRWSPLWRSVPTLHLDDERTRGEASYLRFAVSVYSFLLFRDATHPIKRCTIKCPYDVFFNFNNVNKWLRVVLHRGGVEHLDLDFEIEEEYKLLYKLPISILNCTTLVVLKLRVSEVNDVSSVQLPSLKIMDLESVEFARHGYLSDLLSGCPNLEEFKATYVLSKHDDRILGEFKSLTKLIRACFYQSHVKFSLELICNVECLDLYVYEEAFSDYKHIPKFGNLTHLGLDFHNYYIWQLLLEMLKQCPVLQILVLSQRVEEPEHEEEDWVSPESTPECISSKLRECTFRNCKCNKGELQFARYILRNARVLQIMKIECFYWSMVKFEMKKEISSYEKSSAMCQLLFNF